MNWLLWSGIGTGTWLLLKKPASASEPAPAPNPVTVNVTVPPGGAGSIQTANGTLDPSTGIVTPKQPVTISKQVTVSTRTYNVKRAGLGIYQVSLATDPGVVYEFDQNGPLKSTGNALKLKQLQADISKFPSNLFT